MVVHIFNLICKSKQISEFKASLVQSKFQVERNLGPDVVVHAFNPRTQESEAYRSEFKVHSQSKFQDSQA